MAKPPASASPQRVPERTLAMSVANMTFMVDRLGEDCAPLQFLRELTENAINAILAKPGTPGQIIWDVDWNQHDLTGQFKLSVIDTGIGMTGEEMVNYINKLSSSMSEQSTEGNFGVGAKIAAAPRNRAGLIYLSWKDGIGYMIHLWRDPDTNQYGLRPFERPDGTVTYWASVEGTVKPEVIDRHGTMVVLLGNNVDDSTMAPPLGTPMPSRWVLRYLNTRYFRFPDGVAVKAREGWELPRGDSHNFLRTVTGQQPWLEESASAKGTLKLDGATAHWWVLKPGLDADLGGHLAAGGHMAALFQDELYEMVTGRAGVTRLQAFGVIFGHNRVVIYLEPNASNGRLTSNTSRTNLLIGGEPLPWADWAAEFRSKLPDEIEALVEEVGSTSTASDYQQAIRDRLRQLRDLFRVSRYRPTKGGEVSVDDEALGLGGKPRDANGARSKSGAAPSGAQGGRAGDIYGLFLLAQGVPGEELRPLDQYPKPQWISVEDGKRTPPDLEDRAAKYLPQQNLLLINADFRVFTDMVKRWCEKYSHAPAAQAVVQQVVREWFEQQLVEAIMGAFSLKDSRQWTPSDLERLWSEEALTSVVLPRYHVDNSVKRALGAKLGTLKERVA